MVPQQNAGEWTPAVALPRPGLPGVQAEWQGSRLAGPSPHLLYSMPPPLPNVKPEQALRRSPQLTEPALQDDSEPQERRNLVGDGNLFKYRIQTKELLKLWLQNINITDNHAIKITANWRVGR